jgi:hypothetical protein
MTLHTVVSLSLALSLHVLHAQNTPLLINTDASQGINTATPPGVGPTDNPIREGDYQIIRLCTTTNVSLLAPLSTWPVLASGSEAGLFFKILGKRWYTGDVENYGVNFSAATNSSTEYLGYRYVRGVDVVAGSTLTGSPLTAFTTGSGTLTYINNALIIGVCTPALVGSWSPPGGFTVYSNTDGATLLSAVMYKDHAASGAIGPFTVTYTDTDASVGASWLVALSGSPVTPPDGPLKIAINSPLPGSRFRCPSKVNFMATAYDSIEGDLSGFIQWLRSGLFVGAGPSMIVQHSCKNLGTQTMTANVSNSSGVSAQTSVSYTMVRQ